MVASTGGILREVVQRVASTAGILKGGSLDSVAALVGVLSELERSSRQAYWTKKLL